MIANKKKRSKRKNTKFSLAKDLDSQKTTDYSPIESIRCAFVNSIGSLISKEAALELEKKITIDLTPSYFKGDFTIPTYRVAKLLNQRHEYVANYAAKNLKKLCKYIRSIEVIDGYVNLTVNYRTFYSESLKYFTNGKFFSKNKKIRDNATILFLGGSSTPILEVNNQKNKIFNNLIFRLFKLYKFNVIQRSIQEAPKKIIKIQTKKFIHKALKEKTAINLGNNVVVIQLEEKKYALLSRQDQSTTNLAENLAILDYHLKTYSPDITILSLENVDKVISIAKKIKLIDPNVNVIKDSSQIEECFLEKNLDKITTVYKELEKVTSINQLYKNHSIEIDRATMRLLAYAPEAFNQSLAVALPQPILKYLENLINSTNELLLSLKMLRNQDETFKVPAEPLRAIYEIINIYFILLGVKPITTDPLLGES